MSKYPALENVPHSHLFNYSDKFALFQLHDIKDCLSQPSKYMTTWTLKCAHLKTNLHTTESSVWLHNSCLNIDTCVPCQQERHSLTRKSTSSESECLRGWKHCSHSLKTLKERYLVNCHMLETSSEFPPLTAALAGNACFERLDR